MFLMCSNSNRKGNPLSTRLRKWRECFARHFKNTWETSYIVPLSVVHTSPSMAKAYDTVHQDHRHTLLAWFVRLVI